MNVLEFRRRLMMSMPRKWYPIIQGPVTSQDMINELGDLFQTYEDAPDAHPTHYKHPRKTSAFALDKSVTSAQFGGNMEVSCIVYEEGQEPIMIPYYRTTVTFKSNQTYKHVVCYNGNLGGNNSLSGVKWIINDNALTLGQLDKTVKYFHIKRDANIAIFCGNIGNQNLMNPVGYNGAVYYVPDWITSNLRPFANTKITKIRVPKSVRQLSNTVYFFGYYANYPRNLTDIYVHWGLGEVPQQPGTQWSGQWKLHIPDLGNAELNAALVAEYRSKGWNYVSGQGIFNDVEATEPQEQLD